MNGYIGYWLGGGIGSAIIFWPICYLAARATFKSKLGWPGFVFGFAVTALIACVGQLIMRMNGAAPEFYSMFAEFIVPFLAALAVAMVLYMIKQQPTGGATPAAP